MIFVQVIGNHGRQWGYTGMDVFGATLGIIGMGRIGEAVARRAKGFDMNVLYHNRSRKIEAEEKYGFTYVELDALLQESDFVVLLTPLTPETKGLIGERELGLMKETAQLLMLHVVELLTNKLYMMH